MKTSQDHNPVNNKQPLWLAYVLGIFGVSAFGATLPVTHIALETYTPGFLTFARAIIATILAVLTLMAMRKPFLQANWPEILLSGIFLIFTFPAFMAIAMESVPAAHGGVVLGFLPIATAFIARMIAGETPSPRFWSLSVAGAIVVVSFVVIKADATEEDATWLGYGWLILAGLSASCGYVIFGKLSRTTPGWEIICRALVINSPLSILGMIITWNEAPHVADVPQLLSLLYLGAFSMFLAFCAWNVALAWGGIARMGQLQLLQVFVTIAIASILLGEQIDTLTIAAAILVTAIIAASRKT